MRRISNLAMGVALVIALGYDGAQFVGSLVSKALVATGAGAVITILGQIVEWGAFLLITGLYMAWFWTKGVSFLNLRRGGTMLAGTILEFIPVFNWLPVFTGEIALVLATVYAEDTVKKVTGLDANKLLEGGKGTNNTAKSAEPVAPAPNLEGIRV